MRLYVECHCIRGWAISKIWNEKECLELPIATQEELRPVRFIQSKERAHKIVERWNRRFATH